MLDYITTLKHFVNVESDTQAHQVREMWRQPPGTRVAEGEAVANVEVVRVDGNCAILRCRDNLSKFRTGDALILHRGDPQGAGTFRCELEDDHNTELTILAGYEVSFFNLPRSEGWMLDRDIVDVRHVLLGALDALAYAPEYGRYIESMFTGDCKPEIDPQREKCGWQMAEQVALRARQREAFARGYAASNYYLVQGPPGTGKTWVLAYLATALAQEGQRVLVTALTHRAINNALKKISKETKYPHVIKIGQYHHARDLIWDGGSVRNFERFAHGPYLPNSNGLIVGGTPFAARTNRLRDVTFDTVIFDEAGQVTLPLAIAAMLSGRRHIFIGDHKQMAPIVMGQHREEWVTRSVFETLSQHAPGTMLDITYRMNAEINNFPSKRFYAGKLRSAEEAQQRRLKLKRQPQRYAQLLDPEQPDIFAEIPHRKRGMRSEEEAEIAAGVAAEALACGVPADQIAIVAPYRAQGRLIRKRLHELAADSSANGLANIVVDTVERIQGQERELVIISLTTSEPSHAAQRAAFFFQPNRLNVAITRAKVKRIVIGSPLLFEARPSDKTHQEWVEHFRALYHESHIVKMPG